METVMIQDNALLLDSFSVSENNRIGIQGCSRVRDVYVKLGVQERTYSALVFQSKGDGFTWTIPISVPDEALTLELEEIHCENHGAFSYHVFVNGEIIAFRTYEPLVKAKCNNYIEIPNNLVKKGVIAVSVSFCGGTPVGIVRGWVYRELDQNADRYCLSEPIQINEFIGEEPERTLKIPQKYGKHKASFVGVTSHIPYLGMSKEEIRNLVDRELEAAEQCSLPVHWMLSHWWSGAGYSPDGKGGYFGDLKYGQLCYDQITGKEHPTTPNMWGNTLWPTMHHPDAETVYNSKIEYTVSYINRRLASSVCSYLSEPSFIMEWGTGYWFFNNRDGGDFHDYVIEAAKQDGITLAPQNGLGSAEKDWMFRDNARYHDDQAIYYRKAIGNTPIKVKKDGFRLPESRYANNLYTHTVQAVLYPSLDDRTPAWLSGMGDRMWASSEMYDFTDRRHYEYGYSNTRLGCANLEVTMLSKEALNRYLVAAYAYGMDYVTLFNPDQNGEDAALCALDDAVNHPAEVSPLYRQIVLDVDILRDFRTGALSEFPIELKSLAVSPDGFLFCMDDEVSSWAEAAVSVEKGDTLWIECEVLTEDTSFFTVEYTGTDGVYRHAEFESASAPLDWFNKNSLLLYKISSVPAGLMTISFRFIHKSVTLKRIKITKDWNEPIVATKPLTAHQERVRHRLVQKRLSAERLLEEYTKSNGSKTESIQKAEQLLQTAKYHEAITFLSGEHALQLPIHYSVDAEGELVQTPFSIRLSNGSRRAFLTLETAENGRYTFSVSTENSQTMNIFAQEGTWKLEQWENNITLVQDKKGQTEWEITVLPEKKDLPYVVEGMCKGTCDAILLIEVQPFALGDCANAIQLPIGASCQYRRRCVGAEEWEKCKPEYGDALKITLNDNGEAVILEAEYGICRAALDCYIPPEFHGKQQHNGLIKMTDGHCFELSYNRDYTCLKRNGTRKMSLDLTLDEIENMFHHGDMLEIRYSPYVYGEGRIRAQIVHWFSD